MNYQQAYNKIIEAYFRDEIQPYNACFCFCGTLCDNNPDWQAINYKGIFSKMPHNDFMHYTGKEYADMEMALLTPLFKINKDDGLLYEETLFAGMSAALDVLKQIHIERGEVIDEVQVFVKRELV